MKKSTRNSRNWNRIHSEGLFEREHRGKNDGDQDDDDVHKAEAEARSKHYHKSNWIVLPKLITLRNDELREAMQPLFWKGKDLPFHLDFKQVELFYPCGALYLYACIDQYLSQEPGNRVNAARLPSNILPKQIMQKLGLLDLLNIQETYPTERGNVVSWGLSKGKWVDLASEGITDMEKDFILGHKQRGKEYEPELYTAALEAVANSFEHAYKELLEPREINWWLIYGITEEGFSLVVTDLGASIPYTIPLSKLESIQKYLKELVGYTPDHKFIEIAVNSSIERSQAILEQKVARPTRSATRLEHRGLGLNNISRFSQLPGANVRIYSRNGQYSRQHGLKDGDAESFAKDLKIPISGTTIIWTLPHKKERTN